MRTLPMIQSEAPGPAVQGSIVVYRGPSELNGAPIVAIVSGLDEASANKKTGAMAQLWILSDVEAPHVAQKTGDDAAVCGDCPLRPLASGDRPAGQRACYVLAFQGPRSVWARHRFERVDLDRASAKLRRVGRPLRLGAYGDPAALPRHVVASLAHAVGYRVTGYSHQWRTARAQWLRAYVMASVESAADASIAQAMGWRTFRVYPAGGSAVAGEIVCPATTRGVKCTDCRLCDGARPTDKRKNVAIETH